MSPFLQRAARVWIFVSLVLTLPALAIVVAWYGFLEPPYLSYPQLPMLVEREPKAGEPVLLQVRRCNSDTQTRAYLLARDLVNVDTGARIVLAPGPASVEPGCHTVTSAANIVPPGTPPGVYYVDGYAQVTGRIRSVLVRWHSAHFTVHPP